MRKVLSFVLVLTLVLGSFSMAFAADTTAASLTDVDGNANSDAIQVAYDLGIVTGNPDGTFLPEKAVTRAEFAAMITRALAIPDSALAGYTSTSFKDTVGYGWAVPYLAFCQSKGIMLGDGQGNVMPGRTITVNEAMTMALRAIGYTANSSLLVGAWPANYVSIAQNEELYDDVAASTTVDKASAAQIIYNLLTVEKVAVNTDGETVFQDTNLIGSNLGCDEVKDVILGDDYAYDNSLINITSNLGAYGTAYVNDDDELVAFTVKSTALTGKVDGEKFKVDDTKYDLESTVTKSAIFNNGDKLSGYQGILTNAGISTAAAYADGQETVTINVDLSGKKIKDVYSVVAWSANDAQLADSDVQEDIADGNLLGFDFATDDNDNIDMKSFQLKGVTALSDIEEDDVVYVYTDNDDDIRKVAVGTDTVEGVIEEVGDDFITIDGTDYEFPASDLVNTEVIGNFHVDDEGIFYLDADGKVFDFDGTTGKADTYAVVKAGEDETSFDNAKFKLYLSDDSTKTMYLEDSASDIDWTTTTGMDVDAATAAAMTTGQLVGYSLNSDGDIDALDVTSAWKSNVTFQSSKVLIVDGASKSIDSDAVVFTYKNTVSATGDYDVAALSDVEKGAVATGVSQAAIMYNSDGKVIAMFVDESYVDVEDNDVYGVFNDRTRTKTGDDDVYKFTGFIDGASFTKKTDDRDNAFDGRAGVFGVYKITVDANDVITNVQRIDTETDPLGNEASGIVADNVVIGTINSDRTVITDKNDTDNKYTIADDAVVYKYNVDDNEFSVSKLSSLRKDYTVSLYDTKGDDADGIASVVIYFED